MTLVCLALLGAGLGAGQPEFRPRLLEVRLDHASVPAGSRLAVTWCWQNAGEAADTGEQRVFVHVRRAGADETAPGAVLLGGDHAPGLPTRRWAPGRVVRYTAGVNVPRTTPPGEYVLLVGMFDADAGRRCALEGVPPFDGGLRYLAARFEVVAPGPAAGPPLVRTFGPVPAQSETPRPAPPAKVLEVGQGPLRLVLDAELPRLVAWRLAGHELPADPDLLTPTVKVLDTATGQPRAAGTPRLPLRWTLRSTPASATWRGEVVAGEHAVVTFELVYTVAASAAEVTLRHVDERPGWELQAVGLERLVTTGAGGRMALPWHAGRLIDPGRADVAERAFALDWVTQVGAGVVHGGPLAAALKVPAVDDQLLATTDGGWAALGASFQWRAPARPPVPSLRLTSQPRAVLRFAAVDGRAADWTAGARLLRAGLPARPPEVYRDTTIYKIFCDSPGARGFTTFAQAAALVRKLAALTDGLPQVAYLVGWQHHGHDTGYPDVFTVNERLGGPDGLRAAIDDAARHGAVLSCHDNYDDAYEHSPAWDPALVARTATGELQKGGVWAGGQSYILSFGEQATRRAVERVERTLAAYPLRTSYHLDVLSAVPRRLDFNPRQPAGGEASLAGKAAIVQAFNRRGVDVTSEGFCDPFVGMIGHAWHLMRRRDELFAGEQRIPFVPFVYHGHATWGGGQLGDAEMLDALLYGATFSADFNAKAPLDDVLERIYLEYMPFRLLREREATGYRAEGSRRRMSYGPATFVEVDDAASRYQVVVDGRLVARDFACCVPGRQAGTLLAYARAAGTRSWPAPVDCPDGTRLTAVELTADGPGATSTLVTDGGQVTLTLKAGVPVLVRR